jgi:hypothetical protein
MMATPPVKNRISSYSQESRIPGYWTKSQLAEKLNTSPRTLDRWFGKRIGPPRICRGRLILFRIESVEAWLKSLEVGPVRPCRPREILPDPLR